MLALFYCIDSPVFFLKDHLNYFFSTLSIWSHPPVWCRTIKHLVTIFCSCQCCQIHCRPTGQPAYRGNPTTPDGQSTPAVRSLLGFFFFLKLTLITVNQWKITSLSYSFFWWIAVWSNKIKDTPVLQESGASTQLIHSTGRSKKGVCKTSFMRPIIVSRMLQKVHNTGKSTKWDHFNLRKFWNQFCSDRSFIIVAGHHDKTFYMGKQLSTVKNKSIFFKRLLSLWPIDELICEVSK